MVKGRMQGEGRGGMKVGRQVQRRREEKRNKLRKWSSSDRSSDSLVSSHVGISGYKEKIMTPTDDEGRSELVSGQDYDYARPFMDRFERFLQRYRSHTGNIDEYFRPEFLRKTREYRNAPEQFKKAVDATIDALVKLDITKDIEESILYVANAYDGLETIADVYREAQTSKVTKNHLSNEVKEYCSNIGERLTAPRKKKEKEVKSNRDYVRDDGNGVVVIEERDGCFMDVIIVGKRLDGARDVLISSNFIIDDSTRVEEYELIQCWTRDSQADIGRILRRGGFDVRNLCCGGDVGICDVSASALYRPNSILRYAKSFLQRSSH